jgi:glutaredoxin 3
VHPQSQHYFVKATMAAVEIYTTRFCPYCNAARALLKRRGIAYREIDIAGNWERRDEMIRRANGGATLPQIFCGDLHIGGLSELTRLDASGGLDREPWRQG